MSIRGRNRDIRDEHRLLCEMMDSVGQTIAAHQASRAVVITVLDDFIQHILCHFEHEESGGYFAEAIEVAPRLSERANELLDQHPQMAAQLASLRRQAEKTDLDVLWWRELDERFYQFVECFQRHEEAENALLMDAYTDDIAAED
jgi:hemerythrin